MKTSLRRRLALVLAWLLPLVGTVSCPGQGTVLFANRAPEVGLNAPIFDAAGFVYATGNEFVVQLLAGPTGTSLAAVSPTVGIVEPGFFRSTVYELPGIAPGTTAFAQVRVWSTVKGSTYAAVESAGGRRGTSDLFTFVAGGDTRGGTQPPSLPGYPSNLKSFILVGIDPPIVPEPATSVLSLGGLTLLVGLRWNTRHAPPTR